MDKETKLECFESQSKPEPKIQKYSQIEIQSKVTLNGYTQRIQYPHSETPSTTKRQHTSLSTGPENEPNPNSDTKAKFQRQSTPYLASSGNETKPVRLVSQSKPVRHNNRLLQPKSPQRKTRNVWTRT